MKRTLLVVFFFWSLISLTAQEIREIYHDVNTGMPASTVNTEGTILYPTGYSTWSSKTPVVFVHGFMGELTGSYEAHIEEVKQYGLKAAFVQLPSMGSTEDNGMLLKKMIDRITAHFGVPTVSIVAHSKGGMDTERALYGHDPYNYPYPSIGYEKVDAVYTFGSPLKGSRLADVGSSLSWTGIVWIAMWYTNGYSMTSANVQEFHNWSQSWRINSSGTFVNYYNPSGASYSRLNLVEDNTTRWWVHQSDDPCYGDRWYFCPVGDIFHETVGAYLDAYWEWDWFNSGWRDWYPENDGFISVYRAKRSVIQNALPALTPGAGDYNYMTQKDADHISLWDPGEGHFAREVAPYLHYGLYGYAARPASDDKNDKNSEKILADNGLKVQQNPVYVSNGMTYVLKPGANRFYWENDDARYRLVLMSAQPVNELVFRRDGTVYTFPVTEIEKDDFTGAYVQLVEPSALPAGIYEVEWTANQGGVLFASNANTAHALGVKWNMDERTGYAGRPVEIKISDWPVEELNALNWEINVTRLTRDGKPLAYENIGTKKFTVAQPSVNESGAVEFIFPALEEGEQYAVEVRVISPDPEKPLARSVHTTFYVPEQLPLREYFVSADKSDNSGTDFHIYPNPAGEKVYLTWDNAAHRQITVTDLHGKTYLQQQVDAQRWQLDVSRWKKGIYILQITEGDQVTVEKLIVQ